MRFAVALTLTLQVVAPTLKLLVGVAALAVAHRLRKSSAELNTASWWVVGVAMTYLGASNAIQGLGAIWAYGAGKGTTVMTWFMRLAPVGNQSRTMLVIGMGLVLGWVACFGRDAVPRIRTSAVVCMAVFTVAGAVIGWAQGSMTSAGYLQKAFLDLFELLALFLALSVGLWKDSMDRLLWQCLAAYGFYSALNVIWFSFLSWADVAGAWAPNPIYIHIYATLIHTLMLGIVLHRLKNERGHVHVPTLMESFDSAVRM